MSRGISALPSLEEIEAEGARRSALRPHPKQAEFLRAAADIVIFGGASGGGKTRGLLLEILAHRALPSFSATVFRRTYPQITMPGGIWDEATALFPHFGAEPKLTTLEWAFPSGARIKFAHMQHAMDRFAWKGAQIPCLCFDQVEEFDEDQVWYLLSRNRDPSGSVRPSIRATCNPVPEDDSPGGWLHTFLAWWIDPATGLPIPERAGRLRWFIRIGDDLRWGDSAAELVSASPDAQPKSATFIPAKLSDNPTLMAKDPGYLANLMALPLVERERLLGGNWNVRAEAGKVFNRAWFEIVPAVPAERQRVRYWDLAATEGGGDWTAGVLLSKTPLGLFFVEDVVRGQWGPMRRNAAIRQTAALDGLETAVWVPADPGSGGKEAAEILVRELAGFNVHAEPVTGSKLARAEPFSAQAEAGNVKLLAGPWNAAYLAELHAFDGSESGTDDLVDASSGAFNKLALRAEPVDLELVALGGPRAPRRVRMKV